MLNISDLLNFLERKWTVYPPFPTRCQVIQLQGQMLDIIPLWITITVTIMMTHKIIHMRVIKNSYKHNYDLILKNIIKKYIDGLIHKQLNFY